MNRMTKIAAGIALATCATISTSAFADVSYNVGYASEYHYRGILQQESSASAGIDYENDNGFSVGAWTADVGEGVEVDGYFGYGMDIGGVNASIGYTGYFYTDDAFDDTYEEINFGLSAGFISLEYSIGEWGGYGAEEDYDFLAITIENAGLYGTFGNFGKDFSGSYLELGYGLTVSDIDLGVSFIVADDDLSDQVTSSGAGRTGQSLVFSIGKSF